MRLIAITKLRLKTIHQPCVYDKLKEYQEAINTWHRLKLPFKTDIVDKLKEYQKAIDAYKEAIKIKPDYHEVYYNMGVTYNGLGKYQKAIDAS
jgi:tetratricopeptide (TPR) repeat protein